METYPITRHVECLYIKCFNASVTINILRKLHSCNLNTVSIPPTAHCAQIYSDLSGYRPHSIPLISWLLKFLVSVEVDLFVKTHKYRCRETSKCCLFQWSLQRGRSLERVFIQTFLFSSGCTLQWIVLNSCHTTPCALFT